MSYVLLHGTQSPGSALSAAALPSPLLFPPLLDLPPLACSMSTYLAPPPRLQQAAVVTRRAGIDRLF